MRSARVSACSQSTLQPLQVNLPDAELAQLDALEPEWARFLATLDEAFVALERAKETFREKLTRLLDSFVKDVGTSREVFTQDAPYTFEVCSL